MKKKIGVSVATVAGIVGVGVAGYLIMNNKKTKYKANKLLNTVLERTNDKIQDM